MGGAGASAAGGNGGGGSAGLPWSGGADGRSGANPGGAAGTGGTPVSSAPCSISGAEWCNELTNVNFSAPFLAVAPDGSVVVVRETPDLYSKPDLYVAKYTASGELAWLEEIGTDEGDKVEKIAIDSQGNILIVGFSYSFAAEGYNHPQAMLRKLSANGELLWTQGFDSCGFDMGLAVAIDASDNVVVLGVGTLAFLAAYAPDGEMLWQAPVPSFTCTSLSCLTFNSVTVDAAGNIKLWKGYRPVTVATFSSRGESIDSVEIPQDGRFLIAQPNQDLRAFIVDESSITRLELSSANVIWSAPLGVELEGRSTQVALDASDNVFLLASPYSTDLGLSDVVAYSSDGERLWGKSVDMPGGNGLAAGRQGDAFISMYPRSTDTTPRSLTIAHVIP